MKTITITKKGEQIRFKVYDSIREIPAVIYTEFQKYCTISEHLDLSIEKITERAEILKELGEREQARLYEQNKQIKKATGDGKPFLKTAFGFLCIVDGFEKLDITPTEQDCKVEFLQENGLSDSQIEEIANEVSALISAELQVKFPGSDTQEHIGLGVSYKQLINCYADEILNDVDKTAEINELNKLFLQFIYTKDFNYKSKTAYEHEVDNSFATTCNVIQENYALDVRWLPLFDFLQRIEFLKKKHKPSAHGYY